MMHVPMNLSYLSHREITIEGDTVYLVKLSISGPVLLETRDNKYLEGIVGEIFVQKPECRSDNHEDLRRCAARRLEQLSREAHDILLREQRAARPRG
jgi:hypothetical protein